MRTRDQITHDEGGHRLDREFREDRFREDTVTRFECNARRVSYPTTLGRIRHEEGLCGLDCYFCDVEERAA